MNPEDIIKELLKLAPAQCQCFLDQLPLALPIEMLVGLGLAIYKEVDAKNEKAAMQAAVDAVDAEVDLEETNYLKANP